MSIGEIGGVAFLLALAIAALAMAVSAIPGNTSR